VDAKLVRKTMLSPKKLQGRRVHPASLVRQIAQVPRPKAKLSTDINPTVAPNAVSIDLTACDSIAGTSIDTILTSPFSDYVLL
jgi:hypothetical protein